MTSNASWQTQGRRQHGWFGHGAGLHTIHSASGTTPPEPPPPLPDRSRYPTISSDRSDGIQPVYSLETLLSIIFGGGSLARTGFNLLRRHRRHHPQPQATNGIAGANTA